MQRLAVVLALGSASASAEPLRYGAMVAARATNLTGQIDSAPYVGFSAAGDIEVPLAEGWSIVAEPGLSLSGSSKYRLGYIGLPLAGRLRVSLEPKTRVRVTWGVAPAVLAWATWVSDGGEDESRQSVREHVRVWDLAFIAGVGIERGAYFAEVRVGRGLVTIHGDNAALFIATEELGLWMGFVK